MKYLAQTPAKRCQAKVQNPRHSASTACKRTQEQDILRFPFLPIQCLRIKSIKSLPPPPLSLVMVTISEVKGNSRENRTAAHTHIKGLGLRSDGYAENNINSGFFGQLAAREVRPSHSALTGLQRQTQLMLNDKRHAALWWTSSSPRRCLVAPSY